MFVEDPNLKDPSIFQIKNRFPDGHDTQERQGIKNCPASHERKAG